ncbi:hypothetical protein [Nocardioides sp. zg-1228]|uniref:hypothetical protein n=1 Tax=Nocardioides sp. zg-1228 TaxID=2763008 RepID=UPI0016430E9C|nr:hypothetical protein [Nocardioides sp. zg-1228]MBC2931948.1 hypothetical protein [Nocardioides sp. zg-1228]QSF57504.1 hypothetical protein JX575_18555 [Nocardioides sp. zg-1228]
MTPPLSGSRRSRVRDHPLGTVTPGTVRTPAGAIGEIYERGGVRIVTEDDIAITVITRDT